MYWLSEIHFKFYSVCRKCICNKFSDEELERCPVCNIDLGVVPEEKLRFDDPSYMQYSVFSLVVELETHDVTINLGFGCLLIPLLI